LILVHHLVIDGVSWSVLLPDLATAWARSWAGRTPELAPWSCRSPAGPGSSGPAPPIPPTEDELPWWTSALAEGAELPLARPLDPARDTVATTRYLFPDPARPTSPAPS